MLYLSFVMVEMTAGDMACRRMEGIWCFKIQEASLEEGSDVSLAGRNGRCPLGEENWSLMGTTA